MAAVPAPQDGPVAPGLGVAAPPQQKEDEGPRHPDVNVEVSEAGLRLEMKLGGQQAPLDEAAFREHYLAAMRAAQRAHLATRGNLAPPPPAAGADAPAPAAAAAPAGPAPADGDRLGLFDLLRGFAVHRVVVSLIKISFAAFLFGNRSNFWTWFGVLTAFKMGSLLFTSVKFRAARDTQRYVHPDDEYFSDDDDVRELIEKAKVGKDAQSELVKRRTKFNATMQKRRRQLLLRKGLKCVTTFFVSAFPSWRIENLHAELIRDGIMRDESKRRREPRPEPAGAARPAPAGPAVENAEPDAAEDAGAPADAPAQ